MNELIVDLVFLLITVGWFVIPYIIWVLRTLFRRKWRLLTYQLAIPGLVVAVLFILGYVQSKIDQYNVYGVYVDFEDPIYAYYSEVSFTGDFYTFKVYALPVGLLQRFQSLDDNLLSKYPTRQGVHKDWDVKTWREAPFDPKYDSHLSSALGPEFDPNLRLYFEEVRQCLKRKGTFYAFIYDRRRPSNIDMYVVDLKKKRVYIMFKVT